jgi:hypothetical protein
MWLDKEIVAWCGLNRCLLSPLGGWGKRESLFLPRIEGPEETPLIA